MKKIQERARTRNGVNCVFSGGTLCISRGGGPTIGFAVETESGTYEKQSYRLARADPVKRVCLSKTNGAAVLYLRFSWVRTKTKPARGPNLAIELHQC